MKHQSAKFLLCYWLFLAFPVSRAMSQLVTLDYPFAGVTHTEATAITPSGEIVGRYYTSDGLQHGFTLVQGNFQSIDVPGNAGVTDITWVKANGTIVGSYSTSVWVGYLRRGSQVTSFNYPGFLSTQAYGISAGGDIVGPAFNYNYLNAQGYVFSHGTFTSLNVPGAQGTYPTMELNPTFTVGAFFGQDGIFHGFVLSGGAWTTIDYPGATFTWITGLNPEEHMVGYYLTPDGTSHGFVLNFAVSPTAFTSIDIPDSTGTEVNGIDPQHDLVGRYFTSDGHIHGFFHPNTGATR
jgi:hypothetical protein